MRPCDRLAFLAIASAGAFSAAISTPQADGALQYVAIGALFGTLFGHATLAAAWTALGPGALVHRLPLSLVWLAVVCLGFAINMATFGGPPDVLILIGGCLVGQWLLTQIPLWALSVGYGLRVRLLTDRGWTGRAESQFGLRQLFAITFIIGVVLGVGRAVVLGLAPRFQGFGNDGPIFVFLAVAGILTTMPLILAALLARRALIAVLSVLALNALGTAGELGLLRKVSALGGPDLLHLALINGFQIAWILLIAGLLRHGGYRLQRAHVGPGGAA